MTKEESEGALVKVGRGEEAEALCFRQNKYNNMNNIIQNMTGVKKIYSL